MRLKSLITGLALTGALGTISAPAQADVNPYIGDVVTVGFNFCPRGYAEANGQLLPIAQYNALFSLYGTMYGGDGRSTFGLPDLRGRTPIHVGQHPGSSYTHVQGNKMGQETVTLTVSQMPSHTHTENAHSHLVGVSTTAARDTNDPNGSMLTQWPAGNVYSSSGTADGTAAAGSVTEATQTLGNTGGGQAFTVIQPILPMKICVALEGVYPSRS